jgi:hypothetical protein
MGRDLAPDHPDVVSGRRFRSANQWPEGLPGFRQPLVEYCAALERLVQRLVRVYARALDLPATYFDGRPLTDFQCKLRATHYPSQPKAPTDEFGIAPHTDTSFLPLLAPNDVPGLAFRTQTGDWIDVPTVADAFIVNGGQLLLRWTNDRFLATPHRAVKRTGGDRYALAFFCDAQIDWPIVALPTCVGPLRSAPIRDDLLLRLNDPLSGADLQCVRRPSQGGVRMTALCGSCLCGGVRFEIDGPLMRSSHCHAGSARRRMARRSAHGRAPPPPISAFSPARSLSRSTSRRRALTAAFAKCAARRCW